jgi:hypothetical protein
MTTTRRSFLGSVTVATLGVTATPSYPETNKPPLRTKLDDLINSHHAAILHDRAAWDAVSDLDECEAMLNRPTARVQTSRLIIGRDDNGAEVFKPLYSYSEQDIRALFLKNDHWQPGRMLHGREEQLRDRRAAYYKRMEDHIAALREIEDERQRIEDQCGYTVTLREARRTSEGVRMIEAEIVGYVPASFDDAIKKANWCVWAASDDHCYLYDTDNMCAVLTAALAAIGSAQA